MVKKFYTIIALSLLLSLKNNAQTTFTNTTPILLNDNAMASIYPAAITVSGLTGTISDVKVKINGFTHSYPRDISMVLESPTGQKLLIQADCAENPATNVTYTLSDAGAGYIPQTAGSIANNTTYKSTAYFYGDIFPAPGPVVTYNISAPVVGGTNSTFASTFNGNNANGIWKLWIGDFFSGDNGNIANGWELTVNTNVALPIINNTLYSSCKNNKVLLSWNTFTNIDNTYYVEKKNDKGEFETIATLYANEKNSYTYTDVNSIPTTIYYYRIKSVNEKGDVQYSNIATINCANNAIASIFPNPTTGYLHLHNVEENTSAEIFSLDGRKIKTITSLSENSAISVVDFPSGYYYIHVYSDSKSEKLLFNKQ